MSHSDDSDEEVYLSETSDDDVGSVEGYQNSDDNQEEAGYEQAEPQPASDKIDYALHDAEVHRARGSEDAEPTTPKQPVDLSKSILSPNAAPWVPGTSTSSQPSTSELGDNPVEKQPSGRNPANSNGSQGADEGARAVPIDVEAILRRAAQNANLLDSIKPQTDSHPPDSVSAPVKKEAVSATAPLTPAIDGTKEETAAPSTTKGIVTAASQGTSNPPANGSQPHAHQTTPAEESEQETKALTSELPSTSAAQLPSQGTEPAGRRELPELGPKASELPSKHKPSGKENAKPSEPELSEPDANLPTSSSSQQPETADQAETKELTEELPGSAAAQPPAQTSAEESNQVSNGAEPSPTAPPAQDSSSKAASSSQEAPRPSGMPSLPQRSKPAPRGMPALPQRPPRRSSQPGSSQAGSSSNQGEQGTDSNQPEPRQRSTEGPEGKTQRPEPDTPRPSQGLAQSPPRAERPANVPTNGQTRGTSAAPAGPVVPQNAPAPAPEDSTESEQSRKARAKLRDLRICYFRLATRLGYADHNLIRTIKYRLDQAERIRLDRTTTEDLVRAAREMEQQDSTGDIYDVTVMVIGITGSGKSATINSLMGYEAVPSDAFEGTKNVKSVTCVESGLKLRFVDTPGLQAAADSHKHNSKVLKKIDAARRKYKPDLVIYTERLDMLRRDLSDLPVLRQITEVLGVEMWFNTLIVITHATASGPLNRSGETLNYEQLSHTRSAMFQRALQGATGDHRISAPTAFAENSASCPRNEDGEAVLPNGLAWRKFVLIYLASIKVLREADNELQVQAPRQNNAAMSQLTMLLQAQRGMKLPPLPFLITNMIKHAGPKKLPGPEQDIKREDEILAIKRFAARRREYRKRTRYLKGKHAERRLLALGKQAEEPEVDPFEPPGPGPALSPTFDSDENSFYYRVYEPRPGDPAWIIRPRVEQNVIDHTDGLDSLTTERTFVTRKKGQELDGIPSGLHAIIQKDKVNQMFQGGGEATVHQSWRIVHTGRAQVMTLSGGDVLYISQLETLLKHIPRNHLTLGGMLSRLSEEGNILPLKGKVALGYKLEDEVELPTVRRFNLKSNVKAGIGRASINLSQGRKEVATGANAEWQLTGGKHELLQVMASFSQMQYRGNKGRQYALSGSVPITEDTSITPKLQIQTGGQGNLSLRLNSNDHSSVGLLVFLPLGKALWDKLRGKSHAQPDLL